MKFNNNSAKFTLNNLVKYAISLKLGFHTRISLLGIIVMIIFASQLLSGI
jgi:hypothetical protein